MSLAERIASVKQSQGRARFGGGDAALPAEPDGRESIRSAVVQEFEALLGVIARFQCYGADDVELVRSMCLLDSASGAAELALCIRQWRCDCVTYGLDSQLPERMAQQARSHYRRAVMYQPVDENGRPYEDDPLDALERLGVSAER